MAATYSNQFSSRSHAIIQVWVSQCLKSLVSNYSQSILSKLNLVDLAGSEKDIITSSRYDLTNQNSRGNRFNGENCQRHEGWNINKSLLALGNCIKILSEK